jgi:hypothetical protein
VLPRIHGAALNAQLFLTVAFRTQNVRQRAIVYVILNFILRSVHQCSHVRPESNILPPPNEETDSAAPDSLLQTK